MCGNSCSKILLLCSVVLTSLSPAYRLVCIKFYSDHIAQLYILQMNLLFPGDVISFNDVIMVDEMFINCIGAALFLQILQLLWVLKFNRSLAELASTITCSMRYLKSFFLSFFIIFTAFAMVAYHIYGVELWNYRDYLHACYSQLISILGKFDTNEIVSVGGTFGRIIFMVYQLILLYIFINLLVAILNETIGDIRSGQIEVKSEDEVFDILIEKLGWGRDKKKKNVVTAEPAPEGQMKHRNDVP